MGDPLMDSRTKAQCDEDSAIYLQPSKVYAVPHTHMTADDAGALVDLLSKIPPDVGFIISHVIEPVHTPRMFGGYSAKVILPSGGRGDACGNNPSIVLRTAWARAHEDQADMLKVKVGN